jgi:hypothetical protein
MRFIGTAVKAGKTVIRPIACEVILKSEFVFIAVSTIFSFASRDVARPLLRVQYFEIMNSPSPGTYQTSLRLCEEEHELDLRMTVP